MIDAIPPSISPKQVRAARAWLNITQQQLAAMSLVNRKTIADYERETSVPQVRTLRDIQRSVEQLGIELIFEGQRGTGIVEKKAPG